ncbi:Desmoglein-2 Cadherin family member 5 HDGC Precursor [Channa argus]|uniref:Desmoglein-2 Cadherin family member 5 HDGC n=1 Tax=Channa argus TaxID=215402 RepID=A0A6G1Q9R7_CHAAH|nr:Desmoglein-2 Cadherin family member 5 HDGC Precursor [Channa argus]
MAPLLKCCVLVLLATVLKDVSVEAKGDGPALQRHKRDWIAPPRKLKENHDYTGLASIARIRSDKENYTKILYSLTGPGVDQPPYNVFYIDSNTGAVRVSKRLDREEIAFYHLKGEARYIDGNYAENLIDLNITVEDENDNPPVIKTKQIGYVNESSQSGTVVMKVIATDADQEDTLNSKIYYRISEESNIGNMFYINSETGEVIVRKNTLDRETKDTYKLIIVASDMNGMDVQPKPNTGTGEIEIKILDINDNIPTLEKEKYEGSVAENTINMEVMRIKAIDMDMIYTDNWLASYEIISGNEAGYFNITTDSKTNEGIITIQKALDYEELKVLNLEVAVSNKAKYNFGSGSMTGAMRPKPYPIKINVINQKEGPRFHPSVKVVTLNEGDSSISIHKVIANYAAIDSDTLQKATNVRYAKIYDEDNWLTVDQATADIRLNKLPDRESKFVVNGTYYAKIICITDDIPSKTATGTIAIQVKDFNDHCPTLTTTSHTMCLEDNVIYATAVDEDEFPNSLPFEFTVIEGSSKGKWTVEHFNESTAILRDHANLWPGTYKVAVEVKDQQGKACSDVQTMDVIVCTCHENSKTCRSRSTATAGFGASGILLLLLGLLLLLLIPLLLLFCLCGGAAAIGDFKAIPFDAKQQLISYHTEGQGEDKEIPLHSQVEADSGTMIVNTNSYAQKGHLGMNEFGAAGGGGPLRAVNTGTLTAENMHMYNQYGQYAGQEEMDFMGTGMMTGQEHLFSQNRGGVFDGMAISDEFLEEYYSSKLNHAAQQSHLKDSLLVFDYEGQESLAGSVGCCSLLGNDDDLAFLNDLGPKFKTLAEICRGSTLVTESVDTKVSISPVRPVSPVRPSTSTHTHVHTHTETVRDRDRLNVAPGSSTFIQEERITERAQGAATVPKGQVQDKIMIPSQTLLLQQPTMYYAATPMYVVEPNPQVVLVAGGTQQSVGQVGHVGVSQGLVQVGGLQGSQGMLLVDSQLGMGGVTGHVAQGVSQGTVSRSRQVLVMENGSSGGQQGEHLAQGFVQTGQRTIEQGLEIRGHGLQVKPQTFSLGSHGSAGSNDDFVLTATPKVSGSQRVVVQHKKVSVTERNVESSTRA